MRRVVIVVCSLLAWSCGNDDDYGPPPTCLAGEEGLGRWEYLPAPHYERNLVDPQGTGPLAPNRGTLVWTGTHVLMWGKDQGASLDPAAAPADRWKPLPTENGPGERSDSPVSVWTGTHWIVWGGEWRPPPGDELVPRSDGAMYDPEAGTWEQLPTDGAPRSAEMQGGSVFRGEREAAVWTGSEMLLWTITENDAGECLHQGALYDPEVKRWRSMGLAGSPFQESWSVRSTDLGMRYCPSSRRGPLVWTGRELIVWAYDVADRSRIHAGLYNPETDSWRPLNLEGGLLPRYDAFAAWTGSELLVWGGSVRSGGQDPRYVVTGALYDPDTEVWRPISAMNAPSGAYAARWSVWTGQDLLVRPGESGCPVGARYNLETDTWSAMARSPSEFYRRDTTTVLWAGSAMLIWGGVGHHATFFDGALYYP